MMKDTKKHRIGLLVAIGTSLALLLCANSCRQPRTKPGGNPSQLPVTYEPQRYTIGKGSNLIARVAEPVTVTANIYRADLAKPILAEIRLEGGTWLVPEQMFSIGDSPTVVCNEKYCEVVQ